MLKMIKYEFRKSFLQTIIAIGVFVALEIYFLLGMYVFDSRIHAPIAAFGLFFAAICSYIFVLLLGTISYSSDLKNKSGYLLFMTPISSYKIIGAKLLNTLVQGVILLAIICGLFFIDCRLVSKEMNVGMMVEFVNMVLGNMGLELTFLDVVIRTIYFIFTFLLEFYMIITTAYLSISLSSTILQNKKCKSFVSFILFVVIMIAVFYIACHLPAIKYAGTSFGANVIRDIPLLSLFLATTIGCFLGSGALLNKKISL